MDEKPSVAQDPQSGGVTDKADAIKERLSPAVQVWVDLITDVIVEQVPYALSLRTHLPRARIVYDKFHILKHANAAVDETRRAEFFRKGGHLRGLVRGKR